MPASGSANSAKCPQLVCDLVARFGQHVEAYTQQTYNETQVRREFIDPFFKALGWDVDNVAGHAEAYKDVIHEDAIKVGGSTKAPDYCFRIGGARKFFVEAKKPSVSVGDDPGPAYQLRRYAWTAKLPLSIVTDFEEFAVYDCRIKPQPTDKSSTARVLYVTHDEYAQRWDEIASIFAKDAILKGSFDKYAESTKRKRGTAEVDTEFLKEIDAWREQLARNIALRNPDLSVRDLNYAVGKTIDRIIFLRMCEDRGVETYAQLRTLPNGPNIYPRLVELFRRADERYNSGLFHFQLEKGRAEEPDELTPGLTVDDGVLKDIIKRLYYPECPYEFSVMPAEILGQVYEQFLGKVIRLTKGHRAVVEEKPEVRKAGGVYYTPKYIVDYIVEHTVGKLLEGKTPADVGPILDSNPNPKRQRGVNPSRARKEADDASPLTKGGSQGGSLRILDPACGSGSFLLGAYQRLLDWHLKWYSEHDPDKWAKKKTSPIYQSLIRTPSASERADQNRDSHGAGNWRLTITEKKRILLNNIYGVDIDPQAVEVTKLSLLLKVLEGENAETVGHTLRLFHERALPDLGNNIKCGNSLIGPDFYDNQQLDLLDEEERYRINVFDWQAEFPEIMGAGVSGLGSGVSGRSSPPTPKPQSPTPNYGFDAVIGNPPYLNAIEERTRFDDICRDYIRSHFASAKGAIDASILFQELGLRMLRDGGRTSLIVPNKFLSAPFGAAFREFAAQHAELKRLADFSKAKVFPGVAVYPFVYVLEKVPKPRQSDCDVEVFEQGALHPVLARKQECSVELGSLATWDMVFSRSNDLLQRIRHEFVPLAICYEVAASASAGEAYELKPCLVDTEHQSSAFIFITSGAIDRYVHSHGIKPIRYLKTKYQKPWLPFDCPSLSENRRRQYSTEKVILAGMTKRLEAIWDNGRIAGSVPSVQIISTAQSPYPLKFILAVVNSKFIDWLYKQYFSSLSLAGGYLRIGPPQIGTIPVAVSAADDKVFIKRRDRMVELVQRMLDLHKQLAVTKTPTDKTAIQREIDATDRQIDQLVYELYGLTDEEIRIVEEATPK